MGKRDQQQCLNCYNLFTQSLCNKYSFTITKKLNSNSVIIISGHLEIKLVTKWGR